MVCRILNWNTKNYTIGKDPKHDSPAIVFDLAMQSYKLSCTVSRRHSPFSYPLVKSCHGTSEQQGVVCFYTWLAVCQVRPLLKDGFLRHHHQLAVQHLGCLGHPSLSQCHPVPVPHRHQRNHFQHHRLQLHRPMECQPAVKRQSAATSLRPFDLYIFIKKEGQSFIIIVSVKSNQKRY